MARRLIGTGTTDSNGRVTVSYSGKGAGKLQLVAVNGNLLSETYELLDAMYYDKAIGGTGNYNNSIWRVSNVTVERETDGTVVTPTAAWGNIGLGTTSALQSIDVTTGICIEYDLLEKTGNSNFQIKRSSDNGYSEFPGSTGHHKHFIYHNTQLFTVDGAEQYGGWVIRDYGNTVTFSTFGETTETSIKFANFKVYPI